MANKRLLLRRGTASQHSSFTGEVGEITYVTDGTPQLRIHDGSTAGGITLSSGVTEIGALSDVNLASPPNPGDVLSWDNVNSEWINSPAASADKIEEGDTFVETVDTGTDGHIKLQTEGTERWHITSVGHFMPQSNGSYDIGSADKKVRHLFLTDNSLKFGPDSNNSISGTLSVSGTDLQWNGATIFSGSLPQASDSVSGIVEIADQSEADTGTNTSKVMTPALVKSRIDAALTGGVTYKGTVDASQAATPDLSNATKGDLYKISTAGTLYGADWAIGDNLLVNDNMGGSVDNAKIDKIDNTDEVGILSVNSLTSSAVTIGLDSVLDANNTSAANQELIISDNQPTATKTTVSRGSIDLTNGTDTTTITHQQLTTKKVQRSSGNLELEGSTGVVEIRGDGSSLEGAIKLNCHANSHGVTIKSPPHSAGASYTLTLPTTDGNANQVLTTDGSGDLSWTTPATPSTQNFYTSTVNASGTTSSSPQLLAAISDNRRHHYNLLAAGETYQVPNASSADCVGGIVSIRNTSGGNTDVKLPLRTNLDGTNSSSGSVTTFASHEYRAYVWLSTGALHEIGTKVEPVNAFDFVTVNRAAASTDLPVQSVANENMNLLVELTGTGAGVKLRASDATNEGAVLAIKTHSTDFNLEANTDATIRLLNSNDISATDNDPYLVVKANQVMTFVSDGAGKWHQTSVEESLLSDLSDVDISSPLDSSVLKYNSSNQTWENQPQANYIYTATTQPLTVKTGINRVSLGGQNVITLTLTITSQQSAQGVILFVVNAGTSGNKTLTVGGDSFTFKPGEGAVFVATGANTVKLIGTTSVDMPIKGAPGNYAYTSTATMPATTEPTIYNVNVAPASGTTGQSLYLPASSVDNVGTQITITNTGAESFTIRGASGTTDRFKKGYSATVTAFSLESGKSIIVSYNLPAANTILYITNLDHGLDVGTTTGDLVQLVDVNGIAGLPAVNGSQLTNLPSAQVTNLRDVGNVYAQGVAPISGEPIPGNGLVYDVANSNWRDLPVYHQETIYLSTGTYNIPNNLRDGHYIYRILHGVGAVTVNVPTFPDRSGGGSTFQAERNLRFSFYNGDNSTFTVTGMQMHQFGNGEASYAYNNTRTAPQTSVTIPHGMTRTFDLTELGVGQRLFESVPTNLTHLDEVDIDYVNIANGDVLTWNLNNARWEAAAPAGGGGGTVPDFYRTGDTYGTSTVPSTGNFGPVMYAAGVVGLEEIFILNPTGNMNFIVFDANHSSVSNGFKYNIKNISSSSTVTVKTNLQGSSTIDDYAVGSGITLTQNSSVTLVADSTNNRWYII